jgi:NAD(P)H dehydrogenase (quinone)
MILVTGATGGLGKETINALLKLTAANQIVALVRDPEKASSMAAEGITVRKGDYTDYESLVAAFKGIEKLVMISAPAFSDQQLEANVIQAASAAGVRDVIYTGIQRKAGSGCIIPGVTERDLQMENLLAASGMQYTIAHNALYLDALPFLLGSAVIEKGVLLPSGIGRTAVAARSDLGEALARMIVSEVAYPDRITLSNSQSWSRTDIADTLSEITGRKVTAPEASTDDYVAYLEETGIPAFYAEFAAEWAAAIKAGELEETDPLLESILGRKPIGLAAFFKGIYQPAT